MHRVNAAGKEQVIHLFQPIESFAEATLATEGGYPADARATEPTTVLLVPKERFSRSLAKATRSRTAHARLDESASPRDRGIAGRSHSERHGNAIGQLVAETMPRRPITAAPVEIKLNRTKRVLAAEMGTTSETLSRTLAKFRDQKFLRVKGNTVVVTRPRELQKLLQRNLGES